MIFKDLYNAVIQVLEHFSEFVESKLSQESRETDKAEKYLKSKVVSPKKKMRIGDLHLNSQRKIELSKVEDKKTVLPPHHDQERIKL